MGRFLKEFGADPVAAKRRTSVFNLGVPITSSSPHFWNLTDEIALQLIALSAQYLECVYPFQDHPANKDRPERSACDAKRGGRSKQFSLYDIEFSELSNSICLGGLTKISRGKIAPLQESLEDIGHDSTKQDVDDVFRKFSARLR